MRKLLLPAVFIVFFLIGLSVLLYPLVSDYINSRNQSRVVENYFSNLQNLSEQDYAELFDAAHEYNRLLRRKNNRFVFSGEELEQYYSLLNPNANRVMGVLEIDLINVRLPIYHSTDEGALQIGTGHLEGTSLPVGGIGTHSVITGHRGLPSSTLLSNLDGLVKGDTFVLRILNETLTYMVDRILIVEPHDTSSLAIDPDMDYCTLITCTPYGINSHRLLVRGYRTDNIEPGAAPPKRTVVTEASRFNITRVALIFLSPLLIILPVFLFIRCRKIYERRNRL